MIPRTAKLIEVFKVDMDTAGILELSTKYWPQPGQYLPCQNLSGDKAILTTNLFKFIGPKDKLSVGPLPEMWQPGDELALLPPQGHGFRLPETARRVGLLAMGISPVRLLTLVDPALSQDAAVTLFCDPVPPPDILQWLPAAVEVSPISALHECLDWLDYLALEVNREDLGDLSAWFGHDKLPFIGHVLVRTTMPCRGLGVCSVCAVETTRGWKLACQDGPVFPLEEVLHVA